MEWRFKIQSLMQEWRTRSLRVLYKLDTPKELYMLFLATIVGILTGFGSYFLNILVEGVHFVLFEQAGFQIFSDQTVNNLRIIFPAIGGLTVGLLAYYLSPEVKGHGIPSVIDAVVSKGGYIRRRVAFLTSINSGTTIGSGGSAGKEGPIVQIGAALGSAVGQLFHVSQQRMKVLVGCGAAAGLAAVFNAPVSGVMFAVEIILVDFRLSVFTPIVISSVIATAISHHFVGSSPLFAVPAYALKSPAELPLYLIMGVLGGVVSVVFIKTLYGVEDFFEEKIALPAWVKPAIGGLLTGAIAYYYPALYGFDDSATYTALLGRTEIHLMAILMIAKILATSFTLGSGGTGGLFTPSLFIGAMFGAVYGNIVGAFFPSIAAPPGAYALVGMGVIVAGTIHAPLTALLIIFEVTTDYKIILPLMLGTVTSTLIARWLEKESIYTMKISQFSHRTRDGRNVDILRTHHIENLILKDAPVVHPDTGFDELLNIFMNSNLTTFPVVDHKNKLVGIISLRDLRQVMFNRDLAPLLVAADVMSENVFVLQPHETLEEALHKMELDDAELLPVVNTPQDMRYLGVVTRDGIIKRYSKENLLLTSSRE
ncbi:MAG TPA: chloride channel protein [Caldithrix abyssi]|uniref:Chloride channel protein n=1 Tax=Caldithrix abyssi TaxID=187145 RepID=A0A7V5PR56_CALAY|nr:chloride channel protein [Caldithrix abyssi]